MQKLRIHRMDVMPIPMAKRAINFDDYVTQRVLNSGSGYVLTNLRPP